MRDYAFFDRFLGTLGGDVYPEVPCEPHLSITRMTIEALLRDGAIAAGMRVLDVGCGQGPALEQFRTAGLDGVGITLGADYAVCRSKGFEVHEMDQNSWPSPTAPSTSCDAATFWSTASLHCPL